MTTLRWLALVATCLASTAVAGELETAKQVQAAEDELKKNLAALAEATACGPNKIEASIEWKSFEGKYVDCAPNCASEGKRQVTPQEVGTYSTLFSAMASGCSDPAFKKAFLAKVKKIVFRYDASALPKTNAPGRNGPGTNAGPRFALKGGTLTVGINWESTNLGDETTYWLSKNL